MTSVGLPGVPHYRRAKDDQIRLQRHNAFQTIPAVETCSILRFGRVAGIAADANGRNPGGKKQSSVLAGERVMTRGAA